MKHKKFDEVYPYTYFIIHKISGLAYYGVRISNYTKLNTSPLNDLGKTYFTSLGKHSKWFKDALIKDPNHFSLFIHYTFDTVEEAYAYEKSMLLQLTHKNTWLNKTSI